MGKVTKFAFEAQLLRWTESSSGGATIVLQLADPEDLAIFKTMQLAKKGVVGQRLAVGVAEIGDDERLVPHEEPKKPQHSHFPGGLAGLAVRWCKDPGFQKWILVQNVGWGHDIPESADAEEAARAIVCAACQVDSRSALNADKAAAALFDEKIRHPYSLHANV